MRRYIQLLRQRDFALLWGGATISAVGDGMSFVALLWLLIERGGTPADVGWLAAIYTAPVIIGGFATGVILDMFDPRKVLAADNALRGLAMVSVPIASALGVLTTAHLFVVAGVYGLLFMTSAAGIPSLITRLIRRGDLTTANAMESLSFSLSGLIGPGVAGLLIAIVGAPFVIAIDALTYFVFVGCLLAMREGGRGGDPVEPGAAADEPPASEPATSRGLGPAIRFIFSAPAIVAITLFYMSVNVAGGIVTVVIPLYVRDVLHAGSETFGFLLSVLTAGDLVGPAHERAGHSAVAATTARDRARRDPVRVGLAPFVAHALGPDDPDAPDPARDARPRVRASSDEHAVDPPDRRRRSRPSPDPGRHLGRDRGDGAAVCRPGFHRDLATCPRPRPHR